MRGKVLVYILLAGIVGAVLGGVAQGSIAIAFAGVISLSGLAIAFMLNWVFIAPEAGRRAKENLMRSFAEPTEEDEALIQHATLHILGNMGQIAQHEELKVLVDPLVNRGLDIMDDRWQAILANRKSQHARGAGQFAIPEGINEQTIADMRGELLQLGDQLLDSFGFEEGTAGRKLGQAAILRMLAQHGGNAGAATSTPDYIQQ